MPYPVVRARHVGYLADGTPVVRRLPNVYCLSTKPTFLGAEHVSYNAGAAPILAWAWECCDALCTDAEDAAGTCRVGAGCFPPDGISRRLTAYLFDTATCWTARHKKATLEYDPASLTWKGSVVLRGGTLDLEFRCNAGPNDSVAKFTIIWSGCNSGSQDVGAQCLDPLVVVFLQETLDDCCDCQSSGTPNPNAAPSDTDVAAEIQITVVGNCRKTVFARHVGYQADGTPTVARERSCDWDQIDDYGCGNMACGIVAEIALDPGDGCACLNGSYPLNYRAAEGKWINNATGWGCVGEPKTISVTCAPQLSGLLRLSVTLVCAAAAVGSGFVDIAPLDLEDLDVTVSVPVSNSSNPSECCAGSVPVRLIRP